MLPLLSIVSWMREVWDFFLGKAFKEVIRKKEGCKHVLQDGYSFFLPSQS